MGEKRHISLITQLTVNFKKKKKHTPITKGSPKKLPRPSLLIGAGKKWQAQASAAHTQALALGPAGGPRQILLSGQDSSKAGKAGHPRGASK